MVKPSLPALLACPEILLIREIKEFPGDFVPFIIAWILPIILRGILDYLL